MYFIYFLNAHFIAEICNYEERQISSHTHISIVKRKEGKLQLEKNRQTDGAETHI